MDYEIDMSIPSASEVESEVDEESKDEVNEEVQLSLDQITKYLPHLEVSDLLDILSSVNSLLKKRWKDAPKAKKATVTRKVSPALLRNQAWLAYVQKYAMENGWESFTCRQEKKNKETGEVESEDIVYAGSKPNDIGYSFKDAKTKEKIVPAYIYEDTERHLIYKEAMSLSTVWKWCGGVKPTTKFQSEAEERKQWSEMYRQFVEEYEENHPSEMESSSSTASTPSEPKVIRLTAAEKEAERAEKNRIAEEEKRKKQQAREEKKAEREKKKMEKEEEKERKQQEREEKKKKKEEEKAEKEKKKAEKASPPTGIAKKVVLPAKTTSSDSASSSSDSASSSSSSSASSASASSTKAIFTPKTKVAPPKKLTAPKVTLESLLQAMEDDDKVHSLEWDGVIYFANRNGDVWEKKKNGQVGKWVGMIDVDKNIIDTDVPEPEYEDDD